MFCRGAYDKAVIARLKEFSERANNYGGGYSTIVLTSQRYW